MSTWVQLPDQSYLEVPAGISDDQVKAKISAKFPDAYGSKANSPIAPPAVPLYKPNVEHEGPQPLTDTLKSMGSSLVKQGMQLSAPGIMATILKKKSPGLVSKIPFKGPQVEHAALSPEDLTRQAEMAVSLPAAEGMGEVGGVAPVENPATVRPQPRMTPSATPRTASVPNGMGTALDVASMAPGSIGLAARVLKKFGIGRDAAAPKPVEAPVPTTGGVPWGSGGQGPLNLRGKNIPTPTPVTRPEPAWKSLQKEGEQVPSVMEGHAAPISGRTTFPQPIAPKSPRPEPAWKKLQPTESESTAPINRGDPGGVDISKNVFMAGSSKMIWSPARQRWEKYESPSSPPPQLEPRLVKKSIESTSTPISNLLRMEDNSEIERQAQGIGTQKQLIIRPRGGKDNPFKNPPYVSQDEWDAGHQIESQVENTPKPSTTVFHGSPLRNAHDMLHKGITSSDPHAGPWVTSNEESARGYSNPPSRQELINRGGAQGTVVRAKVPTDWLTEASKLDPDQAEALGEYDLGGRIIPPHMIESHTDFGFMKPPIATSPKWESPSFIHRALPNRPGSINPRPRSYHPEQEITDEELANRLGLKRGELGPQGIGKVEGKFRPGTGPGAMLASNSNKGVILPSTASGERVGYHIAPSSRLEAISRSGLKPRPPRISIGGEEGRDASGVYLSRDIGSEPGYEHSQPAGLNRGIRGDAMFPAVIPESALLRARIPSHMTTHTDSGSMGDTTNIGPSSFYVKGTIPADNLTKVEHGGVPMHSGARSDRLEDIDIRSKIEAAHKKLRHK